MAIYRSLSYFAKYIVEQWRKVYRDVYSISLCLVATKRVFRLQNIEYDNKKRIYTSVLKLRFTLTLNLERIRVITSFPKILRICT